MTVTYKNVETAPAPLGLYSHIARAGNLVFFSGMAALDKDGEAIGKGDLEVQMRTLYAEMGEGLKGEGLSFTSIVQLTTYLVREQDVSEFYRIRALLYEDLFPDKKYPPNATLVCKLADPDLLIEIQFIAAA